MKISVASKVAFNELRANKLRTALMVTGIVVGIAILTVIVAVGEGAQARVDRNLERMGVADVILITSGSGGGIPGGGTGDPRSGQGGGQDSQRGAAGGYPGGGSSSLTPQDLDAIRQVTGVRAAIVVFRERAVETRYGSQSHETILYGVKTGWDNLNNWEIAQGNFLSDQEVAAAERVVVVGSTVAEKLFGAENPIGQSIRIQNVNFEIIGVFNSKGAGAMGQDTDDLAVIPATTFSERLYKRTNYDTIQVRPDNPGKINEVAEDITLVLRDMHGIVPPAADDFNVRIPAELLQIRQGISSTMKIFFAFASLISLVVGGVVIMNIMLISVGERTKEIGLRKALGARKKDIMTQFLAETVVVSLLGGFFGVVAGIGGSWLVRVLAQIPTVVSWKVIALATVFSILVGILFGLQPAKKAGSLHPVDALRNE